MPNFVINKIEQSNGDHEVHDRTSGCKFLPQSANQIDLGYHSSCRDAVMLAKLNWPSKRINGCYHCSNECHTS